MINAIKCFFIIFVLLVFTQCVIEQSGVRFVYLDSENTGVDFSNNLTEKDSFNIIQYLYYYNGSGIGAGDFNNDGKVDLYFGANRGEDQLYINSSSDEITFQNITEESGLSGLSDWTTGVTVVDINQDGLLDIYVCQVGNYKSLQGSNKLYVNQGLVDGMPSFIESAKDYGLDFQGLSTHAAFFDYDVDGDLDMYLLNHSVHSTETYVKGEVRTLYDTINGDRLYRNDSGLFVNVTEEAGIYGSKLGYGLGVDIGDLDQNGYPDIYVANDFHENDYLYLNNGDGTFNESIQKAVNRTSQFSMGVSVSDINNDERLDIISLDMMPEDEEVRLSSVDVDPYDIYKFKNEYGFHYQLPKNHLQINRGLGADGIMRFSDIATYAGIDATDWSWSVIPGDYDNDGDADLFVSNGIHRRPNDMDYLKYLSDPLTQQNASDATLVEKMPLGIVPNVIYEQGDNLIFTDRMDWVEARPSASTGSISADLDNDGDLDIVTSNINDAAFIMENTTVASNYLKLEFDEDQLSIGSEIRIWITGKAQMKSVKTSSGFMSSYIGAIHFGLGDAEIIDSLIVQWPSGKVSKYYDVTANQTLLVDSNNSEVRIKQDKVKQAQALNWKIEELEFIHHEDSYDDIGRQKLMPYVLSKEGPAVAYGDINGDNITDIYLGGAHGQAAQLLIGRVDGQYALSDQPVFAQHKSYEDVTAELIDLNGDEYVDLYVGSGGHREADGSALLMDRVYINDGSGVFTFQSLPLTAKNTSAVASGDYDKDGDSDLLVSYRVNGGSYGVSGGYELLANNGDATFEVMPTPLLSEIGMITDIEWADIDSDTNLDIIIVGEWMPVYILKQENGTFGESVIPNTVGMWQTVEYKDLDGDNDIDLVLGNLGLNNVLAKAEGAGLLLGDFDNNKVLDPVIYYREQERLIPLVGKDGLAGQMNKLKRDYPDYGSFSKADFDVVFSEHRIVDRKLDELASVSMIQEVDGSFSIHQLPRPTQYAPIRAIAFVDVDDDHELDVILGGNRSDVAPSLGAQNASMVTLLYNDGGQLIYDDAQSNLMIDGDISDIKLDPLSGNVIIGRNDSTVVSLVIPQ